MSMVMEDKVAEVPVGLRLRASADDSARWAAAVAGIPLEAELVAVARPGVPFGAVLLGVAQRVGASIGARLEATFPTVGSAAVDDEVAVAAVEWLRDQADGFASAALGFARAVVEGGYGDAVAAWPVPGSFRRTAGVSGPGGGDGGRWAPGRHGRCPHPQRWPADRWAAMSAVVLVGEAERQEVVVVPVGVLADGRTLWRLGTVNTGDASRVIRPAVPAEAQGLVTSTGHVYRFVGWSDGWPLEIRTAEDYRGEVGP